MLVEVADTFRPRVLDVELGASGEEELRLEQGPWRHEDPVLDGVGCLGGAALALALCLRASRAGSRELPLVVAVGDAVRRGMPTAARATVAGVAPLSGHYVDGQIGGGLARRLARYVDGLALRGRTDLRGAVLVLGSAGEVELEALPDLAALGLRARVRLLRETYGACGGLVVGPAGDAAVPYASLANLGDPPSYVGRGGLGARFAASGLTALVVLADPVDPSPDGEALREELSRSPRLFARGEGGTLELVGAFAASGDLRANGYRDELEPEEVRKLEGDAARATLERLACAGCPTACRHVVERAASGERTTHGARFSATYALGANLGLPSFDDSLALLAACDDLGIDARAAGAALALLAEGRARGLAPGPALWGQREACVAELRALADAGSDSPLARGAHDLARELGLEASLREARGLSARPVSSLAALLGQCVSMRGADPMRAFPFLSESGGDEAELAALLEPLELPARAFDPRDPAGKGRLVWWHENLAAMIDASGFCAFSAAGLVGDGVWDLDRLALHLAPPGLERRGRALLAAGATVVLLQRELAERLGRQPSEDRPAWAAESLALPGMFDEYATLRGLNPGGGVGRAALERLGRESLLDVGLQQLGSIEAEPAAAVLEERTEGTLRLRAFGSLAEALGPESDLSGSFPMRVRDLRERLAGVRPEVRALLTCAAVHREGARLAPGDLVHAGEVLDLVVAISGG